jgi:hypothetical protein
MPTSCCLDNMELGDLKTGKRGAMMPHASVDELVKRVDRLHIICYPVKRNYDELKKFFEAGMQDGEETERPEVVCFEVSELGRLLDNFLAAAVARIDLERNMIKSWYEGTEFFQEYQSEKDKHFKDDELSLFIKELRNYAMHYDLPLTRRSIVNAVGFSPTTGGLTRGRAFVIEKAELEKGDFDWKKGKSYLKTVDRSILIIAELVEQYFQKIKDFDLWLVKRILQIHSQQLGWSTGWSVDWLDEEPGVFGRSTEVLCPGCQQKVRVLQDLSGHSYLDQAYCSNCDIDWPIDIMVAIADGVLPNHKARIDVDAYYDDVEQIFRILRRRIRRHQRLQKRPAGHSKS